MAFGRKHYHFNVPGKMKYVPQKPENSTSFQGQK